MKNRDYYNYGLEKEAEIFSTDHIRKGKATCYISGYYGESQIRYASFNGIPESVDVSDLTKNIDTEFEKACARQDEAANRLLAAMNDFAKCQAEVRIIRRFDAMRDRMIALDINSTNRRIVKEDLGHSICYSIKNHVYSLEIYKSTSNNDVDYWFSIFNPAYETSDNSLKKETLKNAGKAKFKTDEEKEAYIEGRIKAYSKYFEEEYPAIPDCFASYFKLEDVLMPGYRIAEKFQDSRSAYLD